MRSIDVNVSSAEPFPVRCPEGEFWLNLAAVKRLTATSDGRVCVEWRAGGAMMVDQALETLLGAVWRATAATERFKQNRELAYTLPGEIRIRA